MRNVDLCHKGGTYAMTEGHCQTSWESGSAVSPPADQGRALVGVLGAKPPGAPEIFHFLSPENGLETHAFHC